MSLRWVFDKPKSNELMIIVDEQTFQNYFIGKSWSSSSRSLTQSCSKTFQSLQRKAIAKLIKTLECASKIQERDRWHRREEIGGGGGELHAKITLGGDGFWKNITSLCMVINPDRMASRPKHIIRLSLIN